MRAPYNFTVLLVHILANIRQRIYCECDEDRASVRAKINAWTMRKGNNRGATIGSAQTHAVLMAHAHAAVPSGAGSCQIRSRIQY